MNLNYHQLLLSRLLQGAGGEGLGRRGAPFSPRDREGRFETLVIYVGLPTWAGSAVRFVCPSTHPTVSTCQAKCVHSSGRTEVRALTW